MWRACADEITAAIADANDVWQSKKGQTVLNSKLRSIEKSEDRYTSSWETHRDLLVKEGVDIDLFFKEHIRIRDGIVRTQTLLGDAIDTLVSQSNVKTDVHVKLPETKLPEFWGNPTEWDQFWDLFFSLVDSRPDIPMSVKFSHLKNSLKGSSAKLIAGFSVTEANYQEAKELLKKTYQDDGRIPRKLIQQLLNLKSPNHNYKELSDFKLVVDQILRSLRAYHDTESADWLILEILMDKLSLETQTFLFHHNKSQYFPFSEFDKSLEVLVNLLENNKSSHKPKDHTAKLNAESPRKSSVTWSVTTKLKDNCIFCSQEHRSVRCPTYPTPESRKNILFKENRCLKCCRIGHHASDCKATLHCTVCKGFHHTFLCTNSSQSKSKTKGTDKINKGSPQKSTIKSPTHTGQTVNTLSDQRTETPTVQAVAASSEQTSSSVNSVDVRANAVTSNGGIALPTALLRVKTKVRNSNLTTMRCFFDSGSQKSFIHPEVLSRLNLTPTGVARLNISTFGQDAEPITCPTIKLRLSLGTRVFVIPFIVTEKVNMTLHAPGLRRTVNMLKKRGLQLADGQAQDHMNDITAIIGADHFAKFIRGTARIDGVNLFNSTGGYIVYGSLPYGKENSEVSEQSVIISRVQVKDLDVDPCLLQEIPELSIQELWDLETIGIKEEKFTSSELRTVQSFSQTIQYDGQKYWARLPWRTDPTKLPTNFRMAVGQLNSLQHQLSRQPDKLQHYQQVIEEYIQNDFIEEVPNPSVRGHYLPHHGVEKNSVTTPLRVVFNASAKAKSKDLSLNDILETGPSLTEKLIDSLLSFRVGKFALVGDISKAFLRIGLQEIDRDYVRFLWSADPSLPPKTYRFKSVLFGSTSSPFLLQATLFKHFENCNIELKEILSSSFYVDNFQYTVDDETLLPDLQKETTACLAQANMPLQEWNSNSCEFNFYIDDPNRKPCPTVLGVQWHTESDTLHIKSLTISPYSSLTKRKVLSICSKVYDPLGLLSPITVKAKLFLQDLWKAKLGWDEILDIATVSRFSKLVSEYDQLHTVKFPRCASLKQSDSRLHIFCDASARAYGAVAYLCTDQQTHLLMSRCRVAPLKTRTIPQLELTAVLVGCRMANYICKVLKRAFKVYVWTDNLPCIQWIQSNNSNIVYVKNRVEEILRFQQELSLSFMHVNTKQNPADLLSRGCSLRTLSTSNLWLKGPSWLCDISHQSVIPIQNCEILTQDVDLIPANSIFPIDSYSKLGKLLRITNYVIKFINLRTNDKFASLKGEQYWLRNQQKQHYPLVYEALTLNSFENKFQDSRKFISDLNLFLDENQIIRSRGRLDEQKSDPRMNNPKLLPPKSYLTRLIIENLHSVHHHTGVQNTLDLVRKEFWIPQGRQTVKKIVNKCVVCKYNIRKAFKYPGPPPLPVERTHYTRPFQNTGVDFTGAVKLKDASGNVTKYYVCLFTCIATRAVHLQLINSLSAESFLLCLRRFVARCSLPDTLLSDNGTNFVAVNKFLVALQEDETVQNYLGDHKIKWHFISPRAPWQGGIYERMIALVKDCLYKALHHRQVTPDELVTILLEVEAIVNNRPLTYLDAHPDTGEILTPALLLYGRSIFLFPFYESENVPVDPVYNVDVLLSYHNYVNAIVHKFHKLFCESYLSALREKHYLSQQSPSQFPAEGELVILGIDQPRNLWHLGKVVKVIPSKDSIVREVEVLTKGSIIRRTINKLIPLELHCEIENDEESIAEDDFVENSSEVDGNDSDNIPPTLSIGEVGPSVRPKRRAAEAARSLVKGLVKKHLL